MTRDEREARELNAGRLRAGFGAAAVVRRRQRDRDVVASIRGERRADRFRTERRRELLRSPTTCPRRDRGSALGADDRIDLDAAIGQLPKGARTVFVLHDLCGYSHDEIAEIDRHRRGTAALDSGAPARARFAARSVTNLPAFHLSEEERQRAADGSLDAATGRASMDTSACASTARRRRPPHCAHE